MADLNISPGKVCSLLAQEHKVELLLSVLKFKEPLKPAKILIKY